MPRRRGGKDLTLTSALTPAQWFVPLPITTLEGDLVRLESLRRDHAPELHEAGRHEAIWAYTTSAAPTPKAMRHYVDGLVGEYEAGSSLPFTVRQLATGRAVGVTRLKKLSRANRSALVGSWYSPAVWRTGVNVEAKLLLLKHAFDTLGCIRVEFRTDTRNTRSRTALTCLGATEEGVLRSCQITRDDNKRDSAVFSILDSEWGSVRRRLEVRLGRFGR